MDTLQSYWLYIDHVETQNGASKVHFRGCGLYYINKQHEGLTMSLTIQETGFNAQRAKWLLDHLDADNYPELHAKLSTLQAIMDSTDGNELKLFEGAAFGNLQSAIKAEQGSNDPIIEIADCLVHTPSAEQRSQLSTLKEGKLSRDALQLLVDTQPAQLISSANVSTAPNLNKKKKKKKAPPLLNETIDDNQPKVEAVESAAAEAAATTETPVDTTDPKAPYREILRKSREMAEALGEQGEELIRGQESDLEKADFTGEQIPQIASQINEKHELIQSIYDQKVKETKQAIGALHTQANQLDFEIRQSGFAPENLDNYLIQIEKLGNSPNASDQSLNALKETLTQGHELVQTLKGELNTAEARAKADIVAGDMAAGILQRGINDAQIQKRREAYKKIAKEAAEIGANKRLNFEKQRLGAMLDEAKQIFNAMNPDEIHANVHENLEWLRNELQVMTDPDSEEGKQLAIKIQNFFESAQGAADIARRAKNQSNAEDPYRNESNQENSHPMAYLNGDTAPGDPLQKICFDEWTRLRLKTKDTDKKLQSKKLRSYDVKRLILLALTPIKIDKGALDEKAVNQACSELDNIIESGRINRFSKGFKEFLKEYKTKLEAAITQYGRDDQASRLLEKVNAVQTKVVRRFKLPSLGWSRRRKDPKPPHT